MTTYLSVWVKYPTVEAEAGSCGCAVVLDVQVVWELLITDFSLWCQELWALGATWDQCHLNFVKYQTITASAVPGLTIDFLC